MSLGRLPKLAPGTALSRRLLALRSAHFFDGSSRIMIPRHAEDVDECERRTYRISYGDTINVRLTSCECEIDNAAGGTRLPQCKTGSRSDSRPLHAGSGEGNALPFVSRVQRRMMSSFDWVGPA